MSNDSDDTRVLLNLEQAVSESWSTNYACIECFSFNDSINKNIVPAVDLLVSFPTI